MPKFEIDHNPESASAFVERRRQRRVRMIVELTMNLISSDSTVSHREARCLVDCARKAILELHPGFLEKYERIVRPHFERLLLSRWPNEQVLDNSCSELVN
jgi:hypothetical protein